MSNRDPGVATTIGFGVGFLLAGAALLLQEFDMLYLRWSFILPLILATVGLLVLLIGLIGAHRAPQRATDTGDKPAERPS